MVRCAARLEEATAAARHTEADLQSRADDLHVQCTRLRAEAFTATSGWQGKVAELQHALDRGKMQVGGVHANEHGLKCETTQAWDACWRVA